MGSGELLLYDIDNALMFAPSASDWEKKHFRGMEKHALLRKLNITSDLLIE